MTDGNLVKILGVNEPADEGDVSRSWRGLRRVQDLAALALSDLDQRMIERYAPPAPGRWPATRWPWMGAVERATPRIRAELVRYLSGEPAVHWTDDADDRPARGRAAMPVITGSAQAIPLFANGRWLPGTSRHFPRTMAAFHDVHPKANIGFGVLDPVSHIETYRDRNRGALQFQLPIIVPGRDGQCRLRIEDEVVVLQEAEAIVFDVTTEHEAWNDSDGLQVHLVAEVPMPFPLPLAVLNRAALHSSRWQPSARHDDQRAARHERGD
jgi:hypothetical protein